MSASEVLIVGAGPTGLMLGCELARRGVEFRLLEAGDRLFPGSRGKGLQPRTLELFDDLGIVEEIYEAGMRLPTMAAWENGRKARQWDMITRPGPTPDVPHAEPWLLPQWRTQEILHRRLQQLGGQVEFGTRLTTFTQTPQGVTAQLRTAAGTEETAHAAYLVAADGGRSTVRTALGTPFTGSTVDPNPMMVADLEVTGLDRDNWHLWHLEQGTLALCPLPGTAFQLFADLGGAEPDTDPGAVRRLVDSWTGLHAGTVHWASVFRARTAMAEQFRTGRVFLAGDAAHIHSPAGAQGLNTGIQDAYNLGWKLHRVLRHGAPDALLDSYQAERLPVAANVLGLSTRLHQGDAPGRKMTEQRGTETHQLHLGYPDSPLTHETRTALPPTALRAGDRAPDAPLKSPDGTMVSLFDLFRGTHFTLLALGVGFPLAGEGDAPRKSATEVRVVRIGGADADVHDGGGHAQRAYGTGLFLIRPDGYVGLATEDLGEVDAYLAGRYGAAPLQAPLQHRLQPQLQHQGEQ
ncbi:FAD-dependent monooxygenase [Streptomyces orinoci]|uniref:FAD-dependent monooxygenase n=1 Tax=Streptomyces orinoci TaxID=67339 RepID=A0ABV3JUE1_STRON|nr:FAD-dependent monooxygenase [Streptomyces orinoci]